MICSNNITGIEYRYRFIPEDLVQLTDAEGVEICMPYLEWSTEYFIVDKWRDTPRKEPNTPLG